MQDDDDEDDFTDEEEEEEDEAEEEDITNESDDDDSDEPVERNASSDGFPSRTNSLLQFENLEKHYESIFQTQRPTVDGHEFLGSPVPRAWRFKSSSQPENLNHLEDIDDDNDSSSLSSTCSSSSSSLLSSDEILSSSHSSRYDSLSRRLSLRSFRSIDSLTSLQQKHEKEQELLHTAELSQSLNDNLSRIESQPADEIPVPARGLYKTMECLSEIPAIYCNEVATVAKKDETKDPEHVCHQQAAKTRRSTENLSEDSGFGDHITKESSSSSSSKNICEGYVETSEEQKVPTEAAHSLVEQRDVDSGDQNTSKEGPAPPLPPPPSFVEGGEETDAIFSSSAGGGGASGSCWQSDPNLLNTTFVIDDGARSDVAWCDGADASDECPVNADDPTMASRLTVASTPNLYHEDDYDDDDEPKYHYRGGTSDCRLGADSTVSLSRVYSLKRINFVSESELSAAPSGGRGSNVQIMTSFVSLTNGATANGKGVHFCPVVAEVNWRDSFSSSSEDEELGHGVGGYDAAAPPSPLSRERLSSRSAPDVSLEATPPREREFSPPLDELVERLLCDSISRRNDKELEQRAQQRARLDLITSPPPRRGGAAASSVANNNSDESASLNESTSTWSSPNSTHASYHSAALRGAMDSSSDGAAGDLLRGGAAASGGGGEKSPATKSSPVGKLGGFLQRFSLKRLSGRKSKKKAAAAAAAAPPVVVGVLPKSGGGGEATSRIIPLTGDPEDGVSEVRGENHPRGSVVSSKPPLPPAPPPTGAARRRPSEAECAPQRGGGSAQSSVDGAARHTVQHQQPRQYSPEQGVDSHTPIMLRKTAASAACIDRRSPSSPHRVDCGLLETDIDSNVTLSTSNVSSNGSAGGHHGGNVSSSPANNKKSRSLLNLDNGRLSLLPSAAKTSLGGATDAMKAAGGSPHHGCNDYRAKSMEFLLDKENQAAVKVSEPTFFKYAFMARLWLPLVGAVVGNDFCEEWFDLISVITSLMLHESVV